MKCVVLANGKYGPLSEYRSVICPDDTLLCADGGANYAYEMGVIPSYIVGDMDSIRPEVREFYTAHQVQFRKYPRRKDFTDTQLALSLAEELGADEVLFLGTLGKRLDHTLSNLYCGIELAMMGKKIVHYAPDCAVYLIAQSLTISGQKGDMVSVLPLSEEARGVCEKGFEYPLDNVVLEKKNPYAVSNILAKSQGEISVEEGVLAVFHYLKPDDCKC